MPLDVGDKLDPQRLRAAFDEAPHPGRHNHVFQSETFVRSVLRPLQQVGVWEYTLLEFAGAEDNHGEFYVVLRKGREAVRLRPDEFFAPLAALAASTQTEVEDALAPAAQEQIDASKPEVARLRVELAQARTEAAALRESFSWRLTQPGRSVAGVLASLRRRWSKEAAG